MWAVALFALSLVACGSPAAPPLKEVAPKFTTDQERFRDVVRRSETSPDSVSDEDRSWATSWLGRTRDVGVIACWPLVGGQEEGEVLPYGRLVYNQQLNAQAVYQLDHAGIAETDPAVLEAGLRSALALYRELLAKDHVHWATLDKVLAMSPAQVTAYVKSTSCN